jgi:hypothetical protein
MICRSILQHYECQKPSHYRSECPKLNDEKPKNKLLEKKVLMATWDDSSDEEEGNSAIMAKTEAPSTESELRYFLNLLALN